MTGTLRRKLLATTAGFDEFIITGDSQASAGLAINGTSTTTPGYDPATDVTDPACFERKQNGTTVVAQDPLDYQGGVATGAISFALPFMRDGYKSRLAGGRSVRVTAAAARGTSLVSGWWQPGGGGLVPAKTRFAAALAESPNNIAKGIIWDGGSNDATSAVSQADFTTYWTAMANDLWTTFGHLPTIVTGIVHVMTQQDARFKAIDDALRALPASFSNVAYINTDTLLGYPPSGPEHWCNVSHRAIGPLVDAAWATL